jgi:hypothetical protein
MRPNGLRSCSKFRSSSVSPVTWMVSDSGVTSMIRASKISTSWMTSLRVRASADTFISASSRDTMFSGSRSRILMTLMSLSSCLVICSTGKRLASTVMVMRERSPTSVGLTASESML